MIITVPSIIQCGKDATIFHFLAYNRQVSATKDKTASNNGSRLKSMVQLCGTIAGRDLGGLADRRAAELGRSRAGTMGRMDHKL
jgi:hypothetical protein